METDWIMHSILVQKHLLERPYLVRNFQRQGVLWKKPHMKPLLIFSFSFMCALVVLSLLSGKSSRFSPRSKYVEIAILARQEPYQSWDCNLTRPIICRLDTPGTPELFQPPLSCLLTPRTPSSLCLNCFGSHVTAPNLAVRPSQDGEKTLSGGLHLSFLAGRWTRTRRKGGKRSSFPPGFLSGRKT